MKRTILLALSLSACTPDSGDARALLREEGYTDIELGSHAFLWCSQSESVSVTFTARRDGAEVHGAVCCAGIFGGCEVRR